MEAPLSPLSSRLPRPAVGAKPRDLHLSGPLGEMFSAPPKEVSSRLSRPAVGPERPRISCHAAPDEAAYAPFRKEGRMNCNNAIKSNRKSGVAKWRDLLFTIPHRKPQMEAPPSPLSSRAYPDFLHHRSHRRRLCGSL